MNENIKKDTKQINTILFDFDGTVMNTNDLILGSWQHTFKAITGQEADPQVIHRTFGETLAKSMVDFFPDFPLEDAIDIYRNYQTGRFADAISPFPGMLELIKDLHQKGYKTAVVTSRLKPTTMEGLQKYGLDQILDAIVTVEDCTRHKPDPEPAQIALKKLSAKPEEALMVGDSKFDIGCANNAGVTSVLVDWAVAIYDKEQEGIFKPDYVIQKAEDVLEILGC
ncbi:HAD-IA family hydrolase [Aminipila butyrica]|uniref:HAD-IA family hydrolase n=1 Tax=Aminipila butyrica TaxID=433296 RepID=A0A858BWN7_9FIRM|nr:HAD-IA family hydrolase [Aminipila butyrica]QIB70501.1 HAD-IA family hydrolase [Aminipila butyrica]